MQGREKNGAGSMQQWVSNYFDYQVIDNQVSIVGYKAGLSRIQIPENIDGYPVTSIQDWAFSCCEQLEYIQIPKTISSIGETALIYTNLKEIKVAEENPYYTTVDGVLFNKNADTLIQFPCGKSGDYKLPDTVKKIAARAFRGCKKIGLLTLNEGLEIVGVHAFAQTSLKMLVLPKTVRGIGDGAFYQCTELKEIILPDALKTIGAGVFELCKNLKKVSLPAFVKVLQAEVFKGCESLEKLELNEGIEELKDGVFGNCFSLKKVVMPKSLKTLGARTFYGCKLLEDIYFKGNAPQVDGPIFDQVPEYEEDAEELMPVVHYCLGTRGWTYVWKGRKTKDFRTL